MPGVDSCLHFEKDAAGFLHGVMPIFKKAYGVRLRWGDVHRTVRILCHQPIFWQPFVDNLEEFEIVQARLSVLVHESIAPLFDPIHDVACFSFEARRVVNGLLESDDHGILMHWSTALLTSHLGSGSQRGGMGLRGMGIGR